MFCYPLDLARRVFPFFPLRVSGERSSPFFPVPPFTSTSSSKVFIIFPFEPCISAGFVCLIFCLLPIPCERFFHKFPFRTPGGTAFLSFLFRSPFTSLSPAQRFFLIFPFEPRIKGGFLFPPKTSRRFFPFFVPSRTTRGVFSFHPPISIYRRFLFVVPPISL